MAGVYGQKLCDRCRTWVASSDLSRHESSRTCERLFRQRLALERAMKKPRVAAPTAPLLEEEASISLVPSEHDDEGAPAPLIC